MTTENFHIRPSQETPRHRNARGSLNAGGRPARAQTSLLNPQPLPPSPGWTRALPPGPDARVKITEAYAAHVARDAFFWAWPLVNTYNRRLAFSTMTEQRYVGPLLEAPLNRLTMLTDYVNPEERNVACPNQDVVYGLGMVALDVSPVVVQVPDFGDRFWVYQIVDLRTDSFVQLGKMYGTTPGFYLLVGPTWNGEVPKGITRVFRASSNTGLVAPRILPGRHPGRQTRDLGRADRYRDVPARGVRRAREKDGVEQAAQSPRRPSRRRGNALGVP